MNARQPILVDTDIGSDIDDALALLLLLHLDDVELLGISTVYGKVGLRAKIAHRILQAVGRQAPVVAGTGLPLGSPWPVWHTGEEGVGLLSAAEATAPLGHFDVADNAPAFLVEQVMRAPGTITVLGIGALTNIALALDLEPRFAKAVRRLVFMGAGVTYPQSVPRKLKTGVQYSAAASHNVRCDVEAARRVFASDMPIVALTNDVTTRVWWNGEPVAQLRRAVEPLESAAVGRLLDTWLRYRTLRFGRPITGTCPHDPLTAAEAVYPGRFVKYVRGRMTIEPDGATRFLVQPDGPHEAAIDVDADGFLAWLAPRLLHAGPG